MKKLSCVFFVFIVQLQFSWISFGEDGHPLSIMQGVSSESYVQISIVKPKGVRFSVYAMSTQGEEIIPVTNTVNRQDSSWEVLKADFRDLASGRYHLVVAEDMKVLDQRTFSTYNPKRTQDPKIAVVSCLDDYYYRDQAEMWDQLLEHEPDYVFMIGDNVYTDWEGGRHRPTSPGSMWKRYVQTRNRLDIFKSRQLIPIIGLWDDHDFGVNDGGRNFKYKEQSKRIFETFYAQNEVPGIYEKGYGVGGRLKIYGQDIFFMDNRLFRSEKSEVPETHFGNEQTKWLLKNLMKSTQPAWIISGDQFFGGYHPYESFQGSHPNDFLKFISQLKELDPRIFLISGDRHLTELMKIPRKWFGKDVFELTTSGLHAKVFPGSFERHPNPLQVSGRDGLLNFSIIKIRPSGVHIQKLSLSSYGPNHSLLYSEDIEI